MRNREIIDDYRRPVRRLCGTTREFGNKAQITARFSLFKQPFSQMAPRETAAHFRSGLFPGFSECRWVHMVLGICARGERKKIIDETMEKAAELAFENGSCSFDWLCDFYQHTADDWAQMDKVMKKFAAAMEQRWRSVDSTNFDKILTRKGQQIWLAAKSRTSGKSH